MSFDEWYSWFEKAPGDKGLPEWWEPRHKEELMEYAREDEYGRLDRDVTLEEMERRAGKKIMTLGMMIDSIAHYMRKAGQL